MKFYFIIAWRNLWRNRRRTFISLASVMLAIALSLFTRSMQKGSYNNMIKAGVSQVGYIQVHDSSYWANKSINYSIVYTDELKKDILENKHVEQILPRLESFCLISKGTQTKGVAINCAPPKEEDRFSNLSKRLIKGEYLNENDDGILIGSRLAQFLDAKVGDTVVLLGSGYQGVSAAGTFPVRGIVRWPAPQIDNSYVMMSYAEGLNFFSPYVPELVSSLSLLIDGEKYIYRVQDDLKQRLGNSYEVMRWDQMLVEMVQEIESDNAGGKIMIGILYLVVAFGIFGTVMMMTFERKREFAIMIAVGMKRRKLLFVQFIEIIWIAILGVLAGVVLIFPVLLYYNFNPIPLPDNLAQVVEQFNLDPVLSFSISPDIFLNQALIVLFLTIICVFYPIWVISRLDILKSIKS